MVRVVGKEALGWGVRGGWGELQQRHRWLQKDNGVISSAWKYLLLWQILILGGAFEQEGSRVAGGWGRGAGGTLQYVRGNYESLKGTNLAVVATAHPSISPAWYCLLFQ